MFACKLKVFLKINCSRHGINKIIGSINIYRARLGNSVSNLSHAYYIFFEYFNKRI